MLVSLRHNPFIIFSAKTPLRALYGRSGAFQCSFSPLILAFSDCSRDAGGYLLPVSGDLNGILIHHCVLARRSLTWIWHQSALRWAGKRSVASPTAPFGIKGSGALLCIKILVFIIFVVKILPEKRQLKSSDSSRKKAASSRKRPFTRCFYFIFFNKSEKQSHSAQHFCPAMTSKTPSQRFFAHAGLSKTKNVYFTINQKYYLYISSFCHGKSLLPSILSSTLLPFRRGWFGRAGKGFRKPRSILFLGRVEDAGSHRVSVSVIEKGGVFRPSSRRHEVPRDAFSRRER